MSEAPRPAPASCCECAVAADRACAYCDAPICTAHAHAAGPLLAGALPAEADLCPACHGEQRWQRIERRVAFVGGPLLLAALGLTALVPAPGWLRASLAIGFGVVGAALIVVAHRNKNRYLERRVARDTQRDEP